MKKENMVKESIEQQTIKMLIEDLNNYKSNMIYFKKLAEKQGNDVAFLKHNFFRFCEELKKCKDLSVCLEIVKKYEWVIENYYRNVGNV